MSWRWTSALRLAAHAWAAPNSALGLALDAARRHEQVHVRQYQRWGPLFLPAYLLSSGYQWLRGRYPCLDNRFERETCAGDAGADRGAAPRDRRARGWP